MTGAASGPTRHRVVTAASSTRSAAAGPGPWRTRTNAVAVLNRFLHDSKTPLTGADDGRPMRDRQIAPTLSVVGTTPAPPVVDVVVPVYNEERALEPSIRRLHAYLTRDFPFSWRITIVDNASTDGTWARAERLARELPGVRARAPRPQGPRPRAARARGARATPTSSRTWTSTSRPISTRCSRSSRRSCRATPTSRSARGSRRARTSPATRSASSSRAATT